MSKHKSFTLKDLAKVTDSVLIGDSDCVINNIATISSANESSITFLSNPRYQSSLENSNACAVIVHKDFKEDNKFLSALYPSSLFNVRGWYVIKKVFLFILMPRSQ